MIQKNEAKPRELYTRATLLATACLLIAACGRDPTHGKTGPNHFQQRKEVGAAAEVPFDHHILVDQFGYRPADPKFAVIRDPKVGYDEQDGFDPAPLYQLRDELTGRVVIEGPLVAWQDGAVEALSGDRGWWFDFSAIREPGRYFVFDTRHQRRSATFAIHQDVYRAPLKAAMRMYFYQRSGFAKNEPHAEACWTDEAAYLGKNQDTEARDVTDRSNNAKRRDLRGGWFDAGDTNKYVTFAVQPVHQLLTSYEQHPTAFTDDFNIPETGNGIPDVLDEVRWEIDWLRRMQYPNGSVALKVGEIKYVKADPPSSDDSARYYVPACTSATIAASGMLAHAAYVFSRVPALVNDSKDLLAHAESAWGNYHRSDSKQTDCDTGVVHAGDADLSAEEQDAAAVTAAIYLFANTGNKAYERFVAKNYRTTRAYRDLGWSRYNPDEGEALLFYTTLPDADPDLVKTLLEDKRQDVSKADRVYGFSAGDDLYRAYLHNDQYHWGSNNPRANYGVSNLEAIRYAIAPDRADSFRTRALDTLHYFHGVNPFAMVYLTNMYSYGATKSADETYHTWFTPDSPWSNARTSICGPPPGYVVGGPNKNAEENGVPASLMPPTRQPPQKSYRDWNKAYPENSWAVTETGIYYQAAYVRLLASFVD